MEMCNQLSLEVVEHPAAGNMAWHGTDCFPGGAWGVIQKRGWKEYMEIKMDFMNLFCNNRECVEDFCAKLLSAVMGAA